MEGKNPEERRRYVRIDIATKINFRPIKEKAQKKTQEKEFAAISKNISVEGICFNTQKELSVGTELELQVTLPSDPEPLLLRGQVRWSRAVQSAEGNKATFDTGVKLYTFNQRDESRYLRYVSDKMMERLSQYLHL